MAEKEKRRNEGKGREGRERGRRRRRKKVYRGGREGSVVVMDSSINFLKIS